MTKNRKIIAIFEIFVMVVATIAISFIVNESYGEENKIVNDKSSFLILLGIFNRIAFSEKGFASALTSTDLQIGVHTCINAKDGGRCVEYPASECSSKCNEACLPTKASATNECKLGTCFDPVEGTCQFNSPRKFCTDNGGTWLDDPNGNAAQCRRGCCILGDEVQFSTEQRCTRMSSILGMGKIFKPEIRTELSCISLSQNKIEGACLLSKDPATGKNICKFTTGEQCAISRGEFHAGILCSNPELNSVCEKQKTSSCLDGKDEIYWFDSCGNRENIYDSNALKSWNNGKVLSKNQSCSIATESNPIANQGTCGNCNYFAGSKCGSKTQTEKLNDNLQNYVCRDLSCRDENGKLRRQGESWCAYRGSVGADGAKRAMDTPGSEHFKKVCIDGEIRTELCGNNRNSICIEQKTSRESGVGTFSTAECLINPWQACIDYNTYSQDEMQSKCGANSYCFVKQISLGEFKFSACAPKNPGAHELQSEEGAAACSIGNQKCTVVSVRRFINKKWQLGGWEVIANKECKESKFTEEMNDLCMSLGDCGAEVNYAGTISNSYSVKNAPKLSSGYIGQITSYKNQKVGDMVSPGRAVLGIPNSPGQTYNGTDINWAASLIPGGIGIALFWAGGTKAEASLLSKVGLATKASTAADATTLSKAALGGALAGGLIGFSITHLLVSLTGIGPGLSPSMTYALLAAGAISGAILGAKAGGASWASGIVATAGFVLLIAVAAVILLGWLFGIGQTKQEIVEFKCLPWEPPMGGANCNECGKDWLPCTPYACQSLGQGCKIVNTGSPEAQCVWENPNDVSAPEITLSKELLGAGYNYNLKEYGAEIKTNESDCIGEYANVQFGIMLNKLGKCKMSTSPNTDFGGMEDYFSASSFRMNFSTSRIMPSMEELGSSSINPDNRAEFNIYVKCQNTNGYSGNRDYAINFCIKPGNDITPPLISNYEPRGGYVRANSNKENITVYTNEPAQCRWDISDSKSYNEMANNFSCLNNFEQESFLGWACLAPLPIIQDEQTFYVRCEDKPWENDTAKRNQNAESYPIKLIRTKPIEIVSAEPDGKTISSGIEPASVEVKVETSGGIENDVLCSYSFDGSQYYEFFDTFGKEHRQIFETFLAGEKLIMLKCTDPAGNLAEKNISFSIQLDRDSPAITGIFYHLGILNIKTNENAQCALSSDSCTFDFENSTIMEGSLLDHRLEIDIGKLYYAKCRDSFNNSNGECDRTIKVVGTGLSQGL